MAAAVWTAVHCQIGALGMRAFFTDFAGLLAAFLAGADLAAGALAVAVATDLTGAAFFAALAAFFAVFLTAFFGAVFSAAIFLDGDFLATCFAPTAFVREW